MTDPYRCLRCSTISIAIYNIIYCLVQFGVLGWQVQAVKVLQWEYENRQLPATGGIDAYQARFPGLYAIYTETPERRRINAMYAIVLICLFLSIIHLMTTIAMLYGAVKRLPDWIIPWFFTCAPLVVMCTAYSVLWWSGDVFNEQLTMSVAEFVGSLAVNGVCFIVVIMYYLRLTGRLSSDKPGSNPSSRSTYALGGHYPGERHRKYQTTFPSPSNARRRSPDNLPPWKPQWPEQPPFNLQKKMRRRERDRERSPAAALRQGYNYPTGRSAEMASLRQRSRQTPPIMSLEQQRSRSMLDLLPLGASAQNMEWHHPPSRLAASLPSPPPCDHQSNPQQSRSSSTPPPPPLYPKLRQRIPPPHTTTNETATSCRNRTPPARRRVIAPIQRLDSSPKEKTQSSFTLSQKANLRARSPENRDPRPRKNTQSAFTRSQIAILRRKSPQRVSFKSKPRVYQRTPESSLSGNGTGQRTGEIHTAV